MLTHLWWSTTQPWRMIFLVFTDDHTRVDGITSQDTSLWWYGTRPRTEKRMKSVGMVVCFNGFNCVTIFKQNNVLVLLASNPTHTHKHAHTERERERERERDWPTSSMDWPRNRDWEKDCQTLCRHVKPYKRNCFSRAKIKQKRKFLKSRGKLT